MSARAYTPSDSSRLRRSRDACSRRCPRTHPVSTRRQNRPKAIVYGYAKAWSPCWTSRSRARSTWQLKPRLPDLVASLDGQIHIDLKGGIDSVNARIRTTFDSAPRRPGLAISSSPCRAARRACWSTTPTSARPGRGPRSSSTARTARPQTPTRVVRTDCEGAEGSQEVVGAPGCRRALPQLLDRGAAVGRRP